LLEHSFAARLVAGGLGALTAVFAAATTRVQSDVKSSLAYAALTQVGLIVVEIAAGWYTVAFVHMAGHACFRLLQFLSAPNVLHDVHGIDALGERAAPSKTVFLIAIERGFLDSLLDRLVVTPFTRMADALTAFDRRLCGAMIPAAAAGPVHEGEDREDRDE